MMKVSAVAVSIVAITLLAHSQEATKAPPLTVGDLHQRDVIGQLGLPLGTATEIEAEIVAGRNLDPKLYAKGYDTNFLLKVTLVGSKKLAEPRILEFAVPSHVGVQLANDIFELHELKTGQKKVGGLNDKQTEELEKGYAGKVVRLVVYEVGGYSGIPRDLPNDIGVWAGRGFHFSTSLIVLANRDIKEQKRTSESPFFEP